MLRRFEVYALRPDARSAQAQALVRALRAVGHQIPEVLDSHVAVTASAPEQLVWEHAYADWEAYERYMRHPYHICVLDRYLLPDSPERVIVNDVSGIGLLGYETDEPCHRCEGRLRRVVPFKVAGDAPDHEVRSLFAAMREAPELSGSIVAENTMGQEWFPGVWSHLWEQTFANEAALDAYLNGTSRPAVAEQSGWRGEPVERSLAISYRLDDGPARPVPEPVAPPPPRARSDGIHMVDTVTVAAEATGRYLDAFDSVFLPAARARGMELVACWHTPAGIGEDVTVMTVFRFRDWAHWDELRKKSVLDPALHEWVEIRMTLVKDGTRRFYESGGVPLAP